MPSKPFRVHDATLGKLDSVRVALESRSVTPVTRADALDYAVSVCLWYMRGREGNPWIPLNQLNSILSGEDDATKIDTTPRATA